MHVILARHGNTFDPGDPSVWAGARTDLPLVTKGREQAAKIGEALKKCNLLPRRILAGPLMRTQETARLAVTAAGVPGIDIEVEERLREIDYGAWEGKSSEEIRHAGGAEELRAWDEDGVWPSTAGWPLSHAEYARRFSDVLSSISHTGDDPVLIVSSNGLFKIFATSIVDNARRKMGTGHLALLKLADARCDVLCWNLSPDAFTDWVPHNV